MTDAQWSAYLRVREAEAEANAALRDFLDNVPGAEERLPAADAAVLAAREELARADRAAS